MATPEELKVLEVTKMNLKITNQNKSNMEETNSVQGRVYVAHTKPELLMGIKSSAVYKVSSNDALLGSVTVNVTKGTLLAANKEERYFNGNRGTVAMKVDGDNYVYGVAVCSYQDRFEKKVGAEIATKRMNENFACISKEKLNTFFALYEKEKSMVLSEHTKATLVLKMIVRKIEKGLQEASDKYQRKIEDHRVSIGELSPRSEREARKLTKEEREAKRLASERAEVVSEVQS